MHADGRGVERLEDRVHLAVIVWDGGPDGLGTNFNDPVNWIGDVLPGAADDAVIPPGATGAPQIVVTSGNVRSITSDRSMRQVTGSTLTLSAASEFRSGYVLEGTGQITGAGNVTLNGDSSAVYAFEFSASMSGPGGLIVAADAVLQWDSSSTQVWGRSVQNFGTVLKSGNLRVAEDADIVNHGEWRIEEAHLLRRAFEGDGPLFVNNGQLGHAATSARTARARRSTAPSRSTSVNTSRDPFAPIDPATPATPAIPSVLLVPGLLCSSIGAYSWPRWPFRCFNNNLKVRRRVCGSSTTFSHSPLACS